MLACLIHNLIGLVFFMVVKAMCSLTSYVCQIKTEVNELEEKYISYRACTERYVQLFLAPHVRTTTIVGFTETY